MVIVRDILRDLGLYKDVMGIGLEFNVGVGGRRLTAVQRQKLNLARALLKRADFLILNRPLTALDQQTQKQVICNAMERARKINPDLVIVSALSSPRLANLFERVIVFDRGAPVGDGTFAALAADNEIFKGLLQ